MQKIIKSIIIVLLFSVIITSTACTKSYTGIISSVSWKTVVTYEGYREVQEEGWNIPDGATLINHITKERSRPRYIAYYEPDSDGDYRPVYKWRKIYDTWYTYKIWKWVDLPSYTQTLSGTDKNIQYKTISITSNERIKAKTYYLYISITNATTEKTTTYKASKSMWDSVNVGDIIDYTVRINTLISIQRKDIE